MDKEDAGEGAALEKFDAEEFGVLRSEAVVDMREVREATGGEPDRADGLVGSDITRPRLAPTAAAATAAKDDDEDDDVEAPDSVATEAAVVVGGEDTIGMGLMLVMTSSNFLRAEKCLLMSVERMAFTMVRRRDRRVSAGR